MTLFAPATNAGVGLGTPRLHAFIIGVADYPHLIAGSGKPAKNQLQLGQVTTPQYTASAIADWFVTKYNNPQVPLGSVELLISSLKAGPSTARQVVHAADPATLANIKASFIEWEARASSHRDNIAVFYFCGHGVMKVNHFLLASDWGNPAETDAWENTIDFDAMRVGMRACKAKTQLFFVDACRETPPEALTETPTGKRFISSDEFNETARFAVFNAAAEKQQAFGPPDGPTYFCEALLAALEIGAEGKGNGVFVVDTYSLAYALQNVMDQYAIRYKQKLQCNPNTSGKVAIQYAPNASVLAVVGCSTSSANGAAKIVLRNGARTEKSEVGETKPLYCVVEAGKWDIDVVFPNGSYPDRQFRREELRPLIYEGVEAP